MNRQSALAIPTWLHGIVVLAEKSLPALRAVELGVVDGIDTAIVCLGWCD
jgi:hypothetical protein